MSFEPLKASELRNLILSPHSVDQIVKHTLRPIDGYKTVRLNFPLAHLCTGVRVKFFSINF